MNRDELIIYRRRLPHWRLEGSVYFVTWRLASGQADSTDRERDEVRGALLYFQDQRYRLVAYVAMNDHVHVLVQPLPNHALHETVHSWKSFTAHELVAKFHRAAPVWQDEYFDRIMRDDAELREKAGYILNNPWKRWPGTEQYPWVG